MEKTYDELLIEMFELKFKTLQKFEELVEVEQKNQEMSFYSPDYLINGSEAPLVVQYGEMNDIRYPTASSRQSQGYKLYLLTGEIEIDEKAAMRKISEAQKGATE